MLVFVSVPILFVPVPVLVLVPVPVVVFVPVSVPILVSVLVPVLVLVPTFGFWAVPICRLGEVAFGFVMVAVFDCG